MGTAVPGEAARKAGGMLRAVAYTGRWARLPFPSRDCWKVCKADGEGNVAFNIGNVDMGAPRGSIKSVVGSPNPELRAGAWLEVHIYVSYDCGRVIHDTV